MDDVVSPRNMGSGASSVSSEEVSTQITGDTSTASKGSPRPSPHHRSSVTGRSTYAAAAKKQQIIVQPTRNSPVKRVPVEHIGTMSDSKLKKNDSLSVESDEDRIPSAKSSSDFDDDAFQKFCGEIDQVIEGHGPVVEASQRRKSSVSSSVVSSNANVLPQLQTASTGVEDEFLDGQRGSGHRGSFQCEQQGQHWYGYPSAENQPEHHQQLGPHFHQQQQLNHYHHQQHAHQHHQQQQQRQQQQQQRDQHHHDQHQHMYDNIPTPMVNAPPPLARKNQEKPISIWKRPEDLAHREQVLRDRFQDTWFQKETPSANYMYLSGTSLTQGNSQEGSTMSMRRNFDLMAFQGNSRENKQEDGVLQDKEGFDMSKFKAANKKTNGQKVDKLLPATYKGYNTSLSRQGTLPSLHRGSVSSTLSSSRTQASDTHGSSCFDDVKEVKYNPSEEALLDFIEKEFS